MKRYFALAVMMAIAGFCAGQDSPSRGQDRLAIGEHSADLGGIHFWYRVAGRGPVLVVQAPGWGVGSEYLQNGLAQLERNFTVIYYDTRGSARSSRPSDAKLMSTDDMIEDLGRLRDYWGLKSITVLGHSNGGAIALGYAIQHPDMVHKLILVDACTEDHDFRAEREQEIAARKDDPRFKDAIAAMGTFDAQTDEEFGVYLKKIMPLFFSDPASGMPRFAKTDTMLPTIWARRAVEAGLPVTKQESLLDHVTAQTLVLVGHDDWICPVTQGQRFNKGIRNSRLVVFDKSGHFPWIEAPEPFFAEVVQFAK
ncbi:MAG TPA: alpha/beta hydrolase [Candidatus Sulfotelmatobacter sp.]|nr:alpha/beta hydrolase [Candidatus Sulfotelmatobacter sp.]